MVQLQIQLNWTNLSSSESSPPLLDQHFLSGGCGMWHVPHVLWGKSLCIQGTQLQGLLLEIRNQLTADWFPQIGIDPWPCSALSKSQGVSTVKPGRVLLHHDCVQRKGATSKVMDQFCTAAVVTETPCRCILHMSEFWYVFLTIPLYPSRLQTIQSQRSFLGQGTACAN